MKRIVLVLCIALSILIMNCDDVVVGENPIVVVGKVIYVFPLDGDRFCVALTDTGGYIEVKRWYEDYDVRFYESIEIEIEKVIVTMPGGNVYPLHRIRSRDYDDIDSRLSFGNTYCSSYSMEGEEQ